jgi:hypothetical protein
MSRAIVDVSSWKWRTIASRSVPGVWTSCASQCTSSTYGLPRILQKTVALSTDW